MPICTVRTKNITEVTVKPKNKPKDKKPGPILLVDSTVDVPYTFQALNDAEGEALASFLEKHCDAGVVIR